MPTRPDEPQFEPLPADLIAASRPKPPSENPANGFGHSRSSKGSVVIGLYFYLHPPEPVAMPKLLVRSRAAAGQPDEASPPDRAASSRPAPAGCVSSTHRRRSFAPAIPLHRRPAADEPTGDDGPPASTDAEVPAEAMPADPGRPGRREPGRARPAKRQSTTAPCGRAVEAPVSRPTATGPSTTKCCRLSADEVKALAALREQPLYTLRDASTKKPIAALPFDSSRAPERDRRGAAAKK